MKAITRALCLAAAVLLGGCASPPLREAAPVDPARTALLEQQRAQVAAWQLTGRVAVSKGSQGGSGRIDWRQDGEHYEISLGAPVTRKSWRLTGDAAGARLEGIDGGPREGADVEGMLAVATGWEIPVRALVAWVRGVGAATAGMAPGRFQHAADGLPVSLEQGGWRIDYRDWYPADGTRPALPRRIEAVSGDARVRLLVDRWQVRAADADESVDAGPDALLRRELAALDLADPAADMRARVAAGDQRPVGVCGFVCLAPGDDAAPAAGAELRIIDASGDVVLDEAHLALKQQAAGYARAYNLALREWLRQTPVPVGADPRDEP